MGLLIPFTGSNAATAGNLEQAVRFAAGKVNDAGGIGGVRIRIVARDTHSDSIRGLEAIEDLKQARVEAVIGPESAEIAQALLPELTDGDVVLISPYVGAAETPALDCTRPWYRLAPSAKTLGEALAKLMAAEAVQHVAIFYEGDDYNLALANSAGRRFARLAGETPRRFELEPRAQTYAASLRAASEAGVETILLATSPRTGALVVNEAYALNDTQPRWFLSPLLKTDLFALNVLPGALQGALGVAPKIYEDAEAFPEAFSERWRGDEPLEGAYFYYDAMAMLALGLQQRAADRAAAGGAASTLQTALRDVAAPPGEAVSWDELESGLERLALGKEMYYSGLTGPMLVDACGARRLGVTSVYSVRDGKIATRED